MGNFTKNPNTEASVTIKRKELGETRRNMWDFKETLSFDTNKVTIKRGRDEKIV